MDSLSEKKVLKKEHIDSLLSEEIHIKNEINLPSNEQNNPIEIQTNVVKKEKEYLMNNEIYIKMEPRADDNEFPVIASSSQEMKNNKDVKVELHEPLIKIEYDDLEDEILQDPLNVNIDIKDKELSFIKMDTGTYKKSIQAVQEEVNNLSAQCTESKNQSGPFKIEKPERNNTCHLCNQSFRHKYLYYEHLSTHCGANSFVCHICQKEFNLEIILDRHMLVHSAEKSYVCDVCKQVYTQKSSDIATNIIHTRIKPYSCMECDKAFGSKKSLMAHKRRHTCKKIYTCRYCTLAKESTIMVRKEKDDVEKPYSCEVCTKTFIQKLHLIRHKRIHVGERHKQILMNQ